MTLQNDFADLIDSLETNLTTMGVSDAEFDSTTGIMGLVNKILDISPSVGGIDVVTSISCSLSDGEVYYGGSVTVTGVLEADKDDTTSTNVDLEGYLKGATVKIYHNNTLVGTAITNQDGEYSFSYDNIVITGENNVYAIFEGTDNYETCTSSNVNLSVGHHMDLSSNKSILSYFDNETATITATYTGGSGETISLYMNGRLLDYMTDNNDGTYTYSYSSHNLGDLEFYATNGDLTTDTINIEDVYYYDTGTINKNRYSVVSGGADISYSENGVTVAGTQSVDTYVKNTALILPSEYEATFTLTDFGGNYNSGRQYCGGVCFDDWFIDLVADYDDSRTYKLSTVTNLSSNLSRIHRNDSFKIIREDNTMKLYLNGNLISTNNNINHTGDFQFRTYKSSGQTARTLTIKDLKVKLLDNCLTATKTILSYADNDTTTITYTPPFDPQGASVKLYDDFEDTLIGEMTYDSTNGIYTYNLSSMGYGDRTLYCKMGSIVLDSIDIEDCTRYDTTEYTTRQDVQWTMPTGDFEVSADFYHTNDEGSFPQLYIGTELNVNNIAYGKIHNKRYGAEFKKNNTRLTMIETNAYLSDNTYHTTKLTRVGDLYTIICDNGETLTYSNNTIPPTYLFIIYVPYSKIKNIKIKPL